MLIDRTSAVAGGCARAAGPYNLAGHRARPRKAHLSCYPCIGGGSAHRVSEPAGPATASATQALLYDAKTAFRPRQARNVRQDSYQALISQARIDGIPDSFDEAARQQPGFMMAVHPPGTPSTARRP